MLRQTALGGAVVALALAAGCHCRHAEITCYSLSNPCEPEGIPFYLPKPLLVVAKNFRNIEESGYGQLGAATIPNSFDHQAEYADLKANVSTAAAPAAAPSKADGSGSDAGKGKPESGERTTPDSSASVGPAVVPSGSFKDGVTPDTFYTYQIIFVPDLTQKYAIKITGGPGEVRAAMNIVNGWMFTGLGPFYLKDSSTAQNIMAVGGAITLGGRGVADVVTSLADLRKAVGGPSPHGGAFDAQNFAARVTQLHLLMNKERSAPVPHIMHNYAQIAVYEPILVPGGGMEWRPILDRSYDREILGLVESVAVPPRQAGPVNQGGAPEDKTKGTNTNPPMGPAAPPAGNKTPGSGPSAQSGVIENAIVNRVAANVGLPAVPAFAPLPQSGTFAAGGTAAAAPAPVGNNVTVNVNERKGLLSCLCPWGQRGAKKKPRLAQQTVLDTGAGTLTTDSVADPGASVGGTLPGAP